jgi:orotate phosphoribosyltransferase
MIFNKDTAEKTAELLLQINAIKLNPSKPFLWASGWQSPIYCDVIAGVATGAIGIGILVAEELGLPFVYVRPEAKKHGRENQVEGFLQKGQTVVVVEDLISTGKSSLMAVEALRNAEANVKGMIAIFSYGFDTATENFKNANVTLNTLSNYENLLNLAVAKKYITEKEQKTLQEWRTNPSEWNVEVKEV